MKQTLDIRTIVGAGLLLFVSASTSHAGQGIYDPFNTCTGLNCHSTTIYGVYDVDDRGAADCFTVQLYTAGAECVRLHLTQAWNTDPSEDSTLDPAMTFVCPDGTVWKDDDSGSGSKPLIKAKTSTAGYCTLQVCDYRGGSGYWLGNLWVITGGSDAEFQLRYGRYDVDNRNCEDPTPESSGSFVSSPLAAEEKETQDLD